MKRAAGIFALRPTGLKVDYFEKRSIRRPGPSKAEPSFYQCGVKNVVPAEEHKERALKVRCSERTAGSRMTMTKAKKLAQNKTIEVHEPSSLPGKLKLLGGSKSDTWNNVIANQTMQTIWGKNSNEEERNKLCSATLAGLVSIGPSDELEGMLAAQLVACHNASMECYRRAMIGEQTFEGRRENLNQANKLSRTYASLLEALNRHRGKGQQKVTVEHVHVHEGGQAIVGNVEGGGIRTKSENQPHAITHAPGQEMRSENTEREMVPVARNGKR
jgi:hypothetical protein